MKTVSKLLSWTDDIPTVHKHSMTWLCNVTEWKIQGEWKFPVFSISLSIQRNHHTIMVNCLVFIPLANREAVSVKFILHTLSDIITKLSQVFLTKSIFKGCWLKYCANSCRGVTNFRKGITNSVTNLATIDNNSHEKTIIIYRNPNPLTVKNAELKRDVNTNAK